LLSTKWAGMITVRCMDVIIGEIKPITSARLSSGHTFSYFFLLFSVVPTFSYIFTKNSYYSYFLAHLSQSDKVSFCDRLMSIVRRQQFLQSTSSLKCRPASSVDRASDCQSRGRDFDPQPRRDKISPWQLNSDIASESHLSLTSDSSEESSQSLAEKLVSTGWRPRNNG
jgi:hypothetical protein